MAIAAPYTLVQVSTTSTVLVNTTAGNFTVPSGNYLRDFVISNGGTATIYVGSFTAVTAVTGFAIAPGQQMIYQGPLSGENSVYGITSSGSATAYVGQGSVVSVI